MIEDIFLAIVYVVSRVFAALGLWFVLWCAWRLYDAFRRGTCRVEIRKNPNGGAGEGRGAYRYNLTSYIGEEQCETERTDWWPLSRIFVVFGLLQARSRERAQTKGEKIKVYGRGKKKTAGKKEKKSLESIAKEMTE